MKLARYVKFREERFGGVLFETRSEKVFALNPTASAIVREIARDGSDESALVAHLTESYNGSRTAIETEVAAFIGDLRSRGLLED
jgi:PqqD family protein of HPr-rel-A system